jgi:hypothetical protein
MVELFIASFFQVFLLGIGSQFARNLWIKAAFVNSWFISISQFTYTRVIATVDPSEVYIFFVISGLGGSLGIASSIVFYKWLLPKINKGDKHEDPNSRAR